MFSDSKCRQRVSWETSPNWSPQGAVISWALGSMQRRRMLSRTWERGSSGSGCLGAGVGRPLLGNDEGFVLMRSLYTMKPVCWTITTI